MQSVRVITILLFGLAAAADLPAQPQLDLVEMARLAEAGDARAAYMLGLRYAAGRGQARDDSQAYKWFSLAAERGLAEAQHNLGIMHATGRGVGRDPVRAARWFALAAEQGHGPSQHALGTLYAKGLGVERDEAVAAKWLFAAAEQGDPRAQYNLAVLYEFGRGVDVDLGEARRWYQRAAAIDYAPAADRLTKLNERLALPDAPTKAPDPRPLARPSKGTGPRIVRDILGQAPTPTGPSAKRAGLPAGRFTVQLSSHKSAADANKALGRYGFGDKTRQVRTQVKGRTWFVVLYGAFANRAQAQAAVDALPAKLKRSKPWIRSVAGLRKQVSP